jgi:uncharacterized membrane protein (GlpM family)
MFLFRRIMTALMEVLLCFSNRSCHVLSSVVYMPLFCFFPLVAYFIIGLELFSKQLHKQLQIESNIIHCKMSYSVNYNLILGYRYILHVGLHTF